MKIFYTADVHGSTICFKKFLNAGKFYGVDAIILSGDITGKMIVPIVEQPDKTYVVKHYGTTYNLKKAEELEKIKAMIEDSGYYPYMTTQKEVEEDSANPSKVEEIFLKLILERVDKWVQLADARLEGQDIACYVMPGNDDRFEVDDVLKKSKRIINPEGRVVKIDGEHEMISTGYTNVTPWNCPRDVPEEKLTNIIESMASKIENMETAIFNFHCPPYDTQLDLGPKLDKDLKPQLEVGGGLKTVPVGSKAVRDAIERYQPQLGLHGHIHESRASQKLGRTLVINPGSEYGEGILRGSLIEISKKDVKNMFVQG